MMHGQKNIKLWKTCS